MRTNSISHPEPISLPSLELSNIIEAGVLAYVALSTESSILTSLSFYVGGNDHEGLSKKKEGLSQLKNTRWAFYGVDWVYQPILGQDLS
jgi:hypothetical protein